MFPDQAIHEAPATEPFPTNRPAYHPCPHRSPVTRVPGPPARLPACPLAHNDYLPSSSDVIAISFVAFSALTFASYARVAWIIFAISSIRLIFG